MVIFTLGTGIGGGIIIGDLLVVGEHSHGGECGHFIIDYRDDARMCGCGQRGHLEAYASATAVIKRTEEALAEGRKSSLVGRLEAGAELTPLLIAAEAEAGDSLALEIVLDTARFIGIGTVSMMHTIDPAGVVLGGAMTFGGQATDLGRRFLATVKEEVRAAGAADSRRKNDDRIRHARRRRRLYRRGRPGAIGLSPPMSEARDAPRSVRAATAALPWRVAAERSQSKPLTDHRPPIDYRHDPDTTTDNPPRTTDNRCLTPSTSAISRSSPTSITARARWPIGCWK